MEESNKPVAQFRAGLITVSVWKNKQKTKEGKEYENVSFQLQNRYKDGEEWKDSKSIRLNQVPKAISLLQRAYDEQIVKVDDEKIITDILVNNKK